MFVFSSPEVSLQKLYFWKSNILISKEWYSWKRPNPERGTGIKRSKIVSQKKEAQIYQLFCQSPIEWHENQEEEKTS